MRRVDVYAALALLVLLAIGMASCSSMPPAPKPDATVITNDVPRIVKEKCKDQRPAAAALPDDDDKLAAIAADDYEQLARVYRAARGIYRERLHVDDVQIKGCAQEE